MAVDQSENVCAVVASLPIESFCGVVGLLDLAWQSIEEALSVMQTTGERWAEADVHQTAGEIALIGPKPDVAKAEAYFERAFMSRVNSTQSPSNCAPQ